ncbi:MAG: heme A synthase, partial [Dehalococcoidia bacterium]
MLKAITSLAIGERGSTAWLSRLRSLLDIRYWAVLTSIATYALIVLGGTVRATDSGLACPDWPRCHGQLIPPLDTPVLIEYSHRLAAVSVGLLILGMAVTAWLWHRDNRFVLAGATLAVPVLIAQALVGGVTVNMELPDTVVAVHLALALLLLALLVVTAVVAFWHRRPQVSNGPVSANLSPSRAFPVLTAVAALATFVLILTGSYVANSGASLVYPDWPLFDGKLVSAGGRLADLHYAHRLMAVVVGLLLLAVAAQAWRS